MFLELFRNNGLEVLFLGVTAAFWAQVLKLFTFAFVDKRFNFIGDMRNHLYRFPQIFAIAFFSENIPIYLSRR